VEFLLLGAPGAREGEREIELSGKRRVALVARLLVDANAVVATDRLIDDVWEGEPPPGAARTLQSHISQLRKLVGERLHSRAGGYLLEVEPHEYDAMAFSSDVDTGRERRSSGDLPGAADAFRSGLARWRGPALAGVDAMWARTEATRLDELRHSTLEDYFEVRLALGDHRGVAADAEAAVGDAPLRERLWEQLMLAQYRSGRQADALRSFQRLRAHLRDELGLEPDARVAELEAAILRRDATLETGAAAPERAGSLPTGVVTFLLTDIVGSTLRWEREPEAMAQAVTRHDELVEETVRSNGGTTLKARGEGDSTFNVFSRVSDAMSAALALDAALLAERWADNVEIVVRSAIHSGEAIEREGDYYGRTVNRAARLRALANGGQILLSGAAAAMVVDQLPDGARLVELGLQTLRDIERPETVYALVPAHGRPEGRSAPTSSPKPATGIPLPPGLPEAPEVFVGRGAEIDRMLRAGAAISDLHRRVLIVEGEPGIGKTSVVARVASTLSASGATVLYGRCDEESVLAHQPFAEALGHYVAHAPDAVLRAHTALHHGSLARLTPALRMRAAVDEPRESTPDSERAQMFAAVADLLDRAAAVERVVFVIEDIQWADASTHQLLVHVAARADPAQLLLLVTARSGELAAEARLAELRVALERGSNVERVALAGLPDDSVRELLPLLGAEMPDDDTNQLAGRLGDETGGNPLFVRQVLRHLQESGALSGRTNGWQLREGLHALDLPETLRDTIAQRVARLGEVVNHALTTASVLGREFELDVLTQMEPVDEDTLLDSLEQATRAGLIVELPGIVERFSFAHALVQQTLYEQLGSARRRRTHARVAEVLEDLLGLEPGQRIAEIAHHALAGATRGDAERVVRIVLAASDDALARLAPSPVIAWVSGALALLDAQPVHDERARTELQLRLGEAQRLLGDAASRETLLTVGRWAAGAGATELLVRSALANNRGIVSVVGAVDEERVEVLEAALQAVGDADSGERALLLGTLATELDSVDWMRAEELGAAGIAMARRLGDPATLLRALTHPGTGWRPHTLELRVRLATESSELAREIGDPLAAFMAAGNLCAAGYQQGDIDAADRALEHMREIVTNHPDPTLVWLGGAFDILRSLLGDDLQTAEAKANANLQFGIDTGQPDAFSWYGSQLAAVRLQQGRSAELIPLVGQLVAANPGILGFSAILARCHLDVGEPAPARALLDEALDRGFDSIPYEGSWMTSLAVWARIAHDLDDRVAACELLGLLEPYDGQFAQSGGGFGGAVSWSLGLLHATLGAFDVADDMLARAIAMHERMRTPYFTALAQTGWGQVLQDSGRDADARPLLECAFETGRRCGYGLIEKNAGALLQDHDDGGARAATQ